ncbi:twin-arginine translocase subunit TatC [Phormidium sp. LEGE 05292]|nr:twin-arginine translocase subunit TatC [Phormidium sp. LEGE 05292]
MPSPELSTAREQDFQETASSDVAAVSDRNEDQYLDELPDEVEMSLFDHLEELRQRIFYALIAVAVGIAGCFLFVKPIVQLLEVPAQGIKFLQLAPGEFFFVSLKVAGYSGLLVASPFILYQIILFVLPGLTRGERRILGPVVLGSSFLFLGGLVFAYKLLIPAAITFFINYGEDVVEQLWSIDRYFEFVLLLLLSTGLAFQVPVIQIILGFIGIVSAKQMLSAWRYVMMGGVVLGAILTPSTDPLTQSLLAGAVIGLYFGGIGLVFLLVNLNGGQKLIQWIVDRFKKNQKKSAENYNSSSSTTQSIEVKQEAEEVIEKDDTAPVAHTSSENSIAEIAPNEIREESPAVVAIQEPIQNGSSVWADEQSNGNGEAYKNGVVAAFPEVKVTEETTESGAILQDEQQDLELDKQESLVTGNEEIPEENLEIGGYNIEPITVSEEIEKVVEELPEVSLPLAESKVESNKQVVTQMFRKLFHSRVTGALYKIVSQWGDELGEVGIKWAISLNRQGEDWVSTPDLSFIPYEKLPIESLQDEVCPIAPELIINIMPGERSFRELVEDAIAYLEAGVQRVWLVDYQARSITVFYADSRPRSYTGEMQLSDRLFDGLELTPEQIFQQAKLPKT